MAMEEVVWRQLYILNGYFSVYVIRLLIQCWTILCLISRLKVFMTTQLNIFQYCSIMRHSTWQHQTCQMKKTRKSELKLSTNLTIDDSVPFSVNMEPWKTDIWEKRSLGFLCRASHYNVVKLLHWQLRDCMCWIKQSGVS